MFWLAEKSNSAVVIGTQVKFFFFFTSKPNSAFHFRWKMSYSLSALKLFQHLEVTWKLRVSIDFAL